MTIKKNAGRTRIALGLLANLEHYSLKNNLRELCRLATEAGRMGADIFFSEEGCLSLFNRTFVKVPGPETRKLAAIARRYRMYIAVGMAEQARMPGKSHNSQVLIDRRGRIAGIYHKMQMTNAELAKGIPGDRLPVFETDFGRIAFLICYDTQFMELGRIAAVKGADLIVFPHVGGAVNGDLIGRYLAYGNTVWSATVGRNDCYVCDPRGKTVAALKAAGKVLAVDADLKRIILPISAELIPWRGHQRLERRPETYTELTGPSVVIASPKWPLYWDNRLETGNNKLAFEIINRSATRQRGVLDARFPMPMHILSDEYLDCLIDKHLGRRNWHPQPRRFRFDLRAGERKRCALAFKVPPDSEGHEIVRLSGKTAGGEDIYWERRLKRFSPVPELRVPRIAAPAEVAQRGAGIRLARQHMNAPARSRTELKLAHDGKALLVYADCRYYGALSGKQDGEREGLSIPIMAEPDAERIFWCKLGVNGQTHTQRREGGHPVEGRRPKWTAKIRRSARGWTAFLRFPFAEFEEGRAASKNKRRRWLVNFQRNALLPPAVDRARYMSVVVTPGAAAPGRPEQAKRRGVEWAVWSPPYARIDNRERLGVLAFE